MRVASRRWPIRRQSSRAPGRPSDERSSVRRGAHQGRGTGHRGVPLVDVTTEDGALELWPGTHADVRSGDRLREGLLVPEEWLVRRRAEVPPVRVPLPRGALLLRDGRLWHRGTTNATDWARPMLAMLYSPWWFRRYAIDFYPDAEPISKQSGVRVTARYREAFDHHVWPPSWELVPKPLD